MKCFTCRTEYNTGPCPTCERNRLLSEQNKILERSNTSYRYDGPPASDDPVIIFWSWVIMIVILVPPLCFFYYVVSGMAN